MPRFVPARVDHLTGELAAALGDEHQGDVRALATQLEALFHHYAGAAARLTESLYDPFDPDRDTVPAPGLVGDDAIRRLLDQLEHLLDRANFEAVDEGQLLSAQDREVLARLRIDPDRDALEEVRVFCRGEGSKAITLRPARNLFRLVEREVPTYARVVVAVRTRNEPWFLLKLFKDVPKEDLELLLPTVRVKMKLLDKLKLSGSGGAAAISAWKMFRLIYLYTPSVAKLLAVPFKIVLLPVMLLIGGIYGGKTVLDYTKIRASYVTTLAEHLYAITLASNRAVLSRIADLAGAEDTKEALLAYAVLLRAGADGLAPEALGQRASELVWDRYRAQVRFDAEDALAKLADLGLTWRGEDGRLRAVPLPAALRKVDRTWDELYAPPTRATERLRRQQRRA